MTGPNFDKELDKFYMREKDINWYYLAAVLQVFSNNADSRFLLIYHQVLLAGSV